ncbi:MAG TPA: hypothetical protein VLU46_12740, partial [Thermoanaerobaculia bacterium]|nr:hypothetical protein [Thermoanaerobaculia bacterium]
MPRRDCRFLGALILVTGTAELWLAWRYFGFLTGDDAEIVAEAFRVATGFRYRAWDIRCVFVPDTIYAPLVWLGSHAGIADVRTLVVIATIPSILATAISTIAVYALAMRWTADRQVARAAAALFALHWIPLGFASTVYPRTIATAAILCALLVLETGWPAWIAGALCGLAFADRFSEIVFLVPLLIVARRRAWSVAAGFLATVVLIVGLDDYLVWGEWFGSLRNFAALTIVQSDFASRVKHQSVFWYVLMLPRWISPALWPFFWIARRQWRAAIFVVIPLVALSAIAHKELRYLAGVVPFAMLVAAIGFASMRSRRLAVALLAIAIVWQLYGLNFLRAKSMAAVEAAQMLGADRQVTTVAMSQLWAYGDRLYVTDRMNVVDLGTPPDLRRLGHPDAV